MTCGRIHDVLPRYSEKALIYFRLVRVGSALSGLRLTQLARYSLLLGYCRY